MHGLSVPSACRGVSATILLALLSCRPADPFPDTSIPDACQLPAGGDGQAVPDLDRATLMAPATPEGPIATSAFAMPADAAPPLHQFHGRLELRDELDARMNTHMAESWVPTGQQSSTLPPMDIGLTQCGHDLLPLERGRVITEDPWWDVYVGPGHAWSTVHDQGMSRAALPFSLSMKSTNCTFNGMLTFLFDDEAVSQVRHQIVQETCHLFSFDMWGQSAATFHPGTREEGVIQAHQDRPRFETKAWSALGIDHPEVDLDNLDRWLTPGEQTARGLLVDDTLYLGDCPTRHGPNPFCEGVLVPSFSLAKTIYAATAMAALAQELEIDPHTVLVPEVMPDEAGAAPGDWSAVTLEHLIDMSTGHYLVAEQSDLAMGDFYVDLSLASRLEAAFLYPHKEAPGERTVYLTPNTQIAAAAMDRLLGADSFDFVVDRIYAPLGLDPEVRETQRTGEGGGQNNGTAFGGYGMNLTAQAIASFTRFLQEGGQIGGTQVLHPARLADMMFQGGDAGAPMHYGEWAYNNGMWGWPLDNYGCSGHVPIMFGVSGITVIAAPNGLVYFTFNDAQEYPIINVLEELDAIAPLCTPESHQ